MSIASKLTQQATLWTRDGTTDRYGAQGWNTPTLVNTHWIEKSDLIRNSSGQELSVGNMIYLVESVNENDWLILGDSTASSDPTGVTGAIEVRSVQRVTSVNGTSVLQKAKG